MFWDQESETLARPNLEALQRNVDLTRDLGFIKASVDLAQFSDLSLVQEAAKRLQ